jgi:hypothetical protein
LQIPLFVLASQFEGVVQLSQGEKVMKFSVLQAKHASARHCNKTSERMQICGFEFKADEHRFTSRATANT